MSKLTGNSDKSTVAGPPPLLPGDFGYFKNFRHQKPVRQQGQSDEAYKRACELANASQGENVIYLGKNGQGMDEFFGNPIGIVKSPAGAAEPTCIYGSLVGLRGGTPTGEELIAEANLGTTRR